MKKISYLFFLVLISLSLSAQSTTDPADTTWKVGGNIGIQFSQAAYSNWQAGGVNSFAGNGMFRVFANYEKGIWAWKNYLLLAYGVNHQDTAFNKTDDQIELGSRVDRMISKNWSVSGLLNFRTQFTNGYDPAHIREDSTRISGFLAPAYTLVGLGLTYKPNDRLNIFLSPLTLKITTVNDSVLSARGAYGVDTGEVNRFELGGYANITYRTTLMENVDLQTGLGLYSNYLNGNFKYVDVNGELVLFMKVNRFITANLSLNVIYDHDILLDTDQDGVTDGPRTQFKEVLGVGVAYNFGYQPPKEE